MGSTIGVGLVGYGLSARVFHAPFVEANPRMRLRSVVQRRDDSARRDYPNVSIASDLDELLADARIDLVVITTPNPMHAPMAKRALEARRHVLIEKPMTVSSIEAEELIELAASANRVLSVYQNRRFDGDFLTLKRLIESGELGDVVDFEARFERNSPVRPERWRERDEPGSGILYDLGSHLIDQSLVLFGLPRSVRADIRRQRPGSAVDDYFALELDYDRLRARLQAGMLVRRPGPHFAVQGTHGSFVKYGMDPQEERLRSGRRPDASIGEDPRSQWGELLIGDNANARSIRTEDGCYAAFFDQLADAIEGQPGGVADATLSRHTIRIIEHAFESARQGGRALPLD